MTTVNEYQYLYKYKNDNVHYVSVHYASDDDFIKAFTHNGTCMLGNFIKLISSEREVIK